LCERRRKQLTEPEVAWNWNITMKRKRRVTAWEQLKEEVESPAMV